ncbi:Thyroid receptor-interacting protein 13, partial [Globisporangium splendens]
MWLAAVEVCVKLESIVACDTVRGSVVRFLTERAACTGYAKGAVEFGHDPLLVEHVDAIRIAEIDDDGDDDDELEGCSRGREAQLLVHVYKLSEEPPAEATTDDDENVSTCQELALPSRSLDGLWESLIYDSAVKRNVLDYATTAMLFSDSKVNPHIISWNRNRKNQFEQGAGAETQYPAVREWFSESGKLVMKLFRQIQELVEDEESLVCVLIDEVESLTAARKAALSGSEPSDAIRVVNALLTQLDSLKNYSNVLILTTSNITEAIDVAFVDRADIKQYIGLPSSHARYEILRSCVDELRRVHIIKPCRRPLLPFSELRKKRVSRKRGADRMDSDSGTEGDDELELSTALLRVAEMTEGFSGRALRKLPFQAHAFFIQRASTEMDAQIRELGVMDIEPPIATPAAPVAVFSRLAAGSQPVRPSSALSFGSSCGSAPKRPSTARASLASSHRRLSQPTSEWSFLAKTPQESNAPTTKKSSLPLRPATAREKPLDINVILPKRPVTARAKFRTHALPDPRMSQPTGQIEPVESVDARATREAAYHEVEQQECVDPLHGKMNLQESLRVKAFQARARGNYALAILQYSKLLEIAPRDPISLFQLAVAYEKTGELHHALAAYEKVISLDDGNYFAYYNIGNILLRKNKHHLVFYRQRGAAYRKRGDFEHASRDYVFYHSRNGHQVKQNDRPWDCQPATDAGSDEGEFKSLRGDRDLSGTGHYPLAGRVVYNSDSLYAVPESSYSDKSEIPHQAWSHRRVFEITRSRGCSRTREDLLDVALCKAYCDREYSCWNSTVFEKAHGTHVFFICRGRVAAHKTVVQHTVQVDSSERDEMRADHEETEFAHSWESLRSEMVQNKSEEEAFPETISRKLVPITSKRKKQQMQLCQVGAGNVIGFQGRHTNNPRTYSAIVTDECDALALPWDDLREVDQAQQAAQAKRTKIVGSKVVCSEGQYVDGMFVVREGDLNNVVHGFLPHDFLERKVQHLNKMIKSGDETKSASTELPQARKKSLVAGSSQRITVLAIQRGGFFFASSSWILLRKSRANANVLGVACAKSVLISRSSADLLFFTSVDLMPSLSSRSRELLQRNAQVCTKDPTAQDRRNSLLLKPNEMLSVSKPPIRGHDMLEEFVKAKKWNKFKGQLIQTILQDKKANKPRNIFRSSCKT